MPRLSLIAAMSRNRVIGRDNAMPWHLSADLKHFKAVTMGKPVIMGRKTFESIGRPLPGRQNIIISRQPGFAAAGCSMAASLEQALAACSGAEEVFVIGGSEIYRLALPAADRLHLTEIDADFEGDTHFPAINAAEWRESSRDSHAAGETPFAYAFVVYDRVR